MDDTIYGSLDTRDFNIDLNDDECNGNGWSFFEDYELWLRCLNRGLSVHNIDRTLVAMKRSSYLSKRNGFKI